MGKGIVVVLFLVGVVVGVIVLWNNSLYKRVDPGSVGLLVDYQTGNITPQKVGWIQVGRYQSLQVYPLGTQTYIMDNNPAEGQMKGPDAVECLTRDTQKLSIDEAIEWRMNPDQAVHMYTTRRDVPLTGPLNRDAPGNFIEDLVVRPDARRVVVDTCARYGWEEILGAKRADFQSDVDKLTKELLNDKDIVVNSVTIRQARPNEALAGLMAARLEGQKQAEAAGFAAQQAVRQGDLNAAQADAKAKSDLITIRAKAAQDQAQADAQNTINLNKAKADAESIRETGTAQAEANRAIAASITPTFVDHERAQRWDGRLPTTTLGSDTNLINQVQK